MFAKLLILPSTKKGLFLCCHIDGTMVNIFFTDWDPIVAARDSCDSYVIKVPVEVCTILSAVHWRTGYDGPVSSGLPLSFVADQNDRNSSHEKGLGVKTEGLLAPAIGPYRDSKTIKSSSEIYRWVAKSTGNYGYAIEYGQELISEYKRRYDNRQHLSEGALLWLKDNVPDIPDGPITEDVGLAMPGVYKDRKNPTYSYKLYLVSEKHNVLKWDRGAMPEWYRKMGIERLRQNIGNGATIDL